MSTETALKSWQLQCSEDNMNWQTVHIALEQKNWTTTPRQFQLSGVSHLPISGRLLGYTKLNGAIVRTLVNCSIRFIGGVKVGGFISIKNVTLSSTILAKIPVLVYGAVRGYFLDFSFNMGGRVGTGGRWASVINTYTNGVLSTTATICFRGRILISGRMAGIVSALITNLKLVTIVSILGNINIQDFNVVTFTGRGKVLTGGIFIRTLQSVVGVFYGSNTRFLVNLTLSTLHTQIYLRTPVSGVIAAHTDSDLTFSFTGLVPQPVYITGRMHTDSVHLFIRIIIRALVDFQGILENTTSLNTFAVTYYGQTIRYTQSVIGSIFGKTGPPIIGRINSGPLALTPRLSGIGHVLGSIAANSKSISSYIILKVPSAIYGQFVSDFNTLSSNLRIKNFKWFKTEWADLRTADVQSSAKGFSLTGGHWKSVGDNLESISVYSQIKLVVPISINCVSHPVLQPVFSLGSIIGSAPVYGTVKLYCANLASKNFIGNSNTGRSKVTTDLLSGKFRLLTIVHAIGTFNYSFPSASLTIDIYGRISNRGQIKAVLPNYLTGQFSMHTPIQPIPIYGLIKSTLQSILPTLELQMRLKHGQLITTLDNSQLQFKAVSVCHGIFNQQLPAINLKIVFNFHHFAGVISTATESPMGLIKAHSRSLAFMKLTLSSFKFNFVTHMIPTYRGHMDLDIGAYQSSSIPAYNGGLFSNIAVIYYRLLYGKLETTTKSLQYSDIFAKTPRIIYGLYITTLGNVLGRFNTRVTVMGRMITDMGVDSIKNCSIYGTHNIARVSITNLDLDFYKSGFKGIAAHAIIGRVLTTILSERIAFGLNTYVYPLRTAIKVRVEIVGSLFIVTKGVSSVYFRSANSTLGTLIGGDAKPTESCDYPAPCRPELVQRIGRAIDVSDKIYWTLGWTIGKILVQHRFPIIGILYTPDLERSTSLVSTTRLHGNITGIVPFIATMDFTLNSYVDWASGLLIYAQFKGFLIKGPLSLKLKDCVGNIVLSARVYTYGSLAADLKPANGQIGGYHTLKGRLHLIAEKITTSIGGKVPIPYKVTLSIIMDWPTSKLNLYTPITTFGIFRNTYLNATTVFAQFIGYIPIYVSCNLTLPNPIKKLDIYGRLTYVTGTFIPTARLGNVRANIELSTPAAGSNIGYTKGYFVTKTTSSVTGQIQLRANIYSNLALNLVNTTAVFVLRTPIRILAYSWVDLALITPNISGVVWPAGKLILSTPIIVSYISTTYKIPILVTTNLSLMAISSNLSLVSLIGANGNLLLSSLLFNTRVFYGRFGYLSLIPNDDNWLSVGLVYYPTLYLPPEPRYTVAGTVDNKTHQQRTYSMILFHKTTGEFVQKLPLNQQVPFDYAFSTVASGDYFVLCKPTQTVVGSKAHVVTVQFEKEPIFA